MPSDIKTILYACDLGDHSRSAFHMAASLATTYNAKVIFLYVVEPLTPTQVSAISVYYPIESLMEANARSMESVHEKIRERIAKFCQEEMSEGQFPGGEPEPHVIEGVPATTIIKTAEKMNADLIVMGSHSHSTLDTLFIGSVANKVVNRSNKPVLLVPVEKAP